MASTKWRDVYESEDNLEKQKNILNEEIYYGISLRKDRIQEKQILLAPDEDSLLNKDKDLIPPMHKPKKKKKKKKRKTLDHQTLSAEKFVGNRHALSRKEYYNLMSQPRRKFSPAEIIKIKSKLKTWSPRFAQLAIPLKQRVYNTWQDYYRVLSPEQILGLKQLMHKEEALAPKDASDYFKNLDRQKKIEKRKKLKKQKQEIVKKPQKTKIKKEINSLAKTLIKYFTEKDEATVKHAHVMMTDMIKKKLEEGNLIPSGTKRHLESDLSSQILYGMLDQLSVWLLSNIGFDELEEDEEEERKESSSVSTFSSITYSDVSTIYSEVSAVEPEVVLVEEKLEPSEAGDVGRGDEGEEAAIEREMEAAVLEQEGAEEGRGGDEIKDIESVEKVEPEGAPSKEGGEQGEDEQIVPEEGPITEEVDDAIKEETSAEEEAAAAKEAAAEEAAGEEAGKPEEDAEAEGVAAEGAAAEGAVTEEAAAEEGDKPEEAAAEETVKPEEAAEAEGAAAEEAVEEEDAAKAEEATEAEEAAKAEEAARAEEDAEAEMMLQVEGAGEELPEAIEELLTFPKEGAEGEEIVLAIVAPEEMAEIKATEEEILGLQKEILEEVQPKTAAEVEEHSPDAMCCVTIKTWAKWLVDVSHNTYHWSQWIQDVISRVRLFVAVIRGEVMNPDGKPRKLYKEEWNAFTEMLDKDIDSWKKYNEHVKSISEKIIAEFKNKRIICCPACLRSKIIISEETAHQVTEDLVKALNTSSYFRDWLDAIVAEAKKFRDLKFELPSAPEDLDASSGSSFGLFEIVEIKSPDSITKSSTSSGSVFVIEEVKSDHKNDDKNDCHCRKK